MKFFVFLFILLLKPLNLSECPVKLLKVLKDQFTDYLKNSKEPSIKKFECSYDHGYNPFSLQHQIKGVVKTKSKNFRYNMNLKSNIFNVFNYSSMNMKVCSQSIGNKG